MNQQRKTARFIALVLILLASVIFSALLHHDLIHQLHYPPGTDQDAYLQVGRDFADRHVVRWIIPIYSIWMGGFYLLNSKDMESTFWSEKFVSVLLFAILAGWLGWRLFGPALGLLMSLWTLNCKYLVLETNGTHALATSVAILGALCFFLPRKNLRLPAATFLLFLSTQVRQDMWAPFLAFCFALAILFLRDVWRKSKLRFKRLEQASVLPWIAALVMSVFVYAALAWQMTPRPAHRINITFGEYYAYQYVQRHALQSKFADPWNQWLDIIKESMPDLADPSLISPLAVARRHPSELIAHVTFNAKTAIVAVPAMIGGLMHPLLFSVISIGLVLYYILTDLRESPQKSRPELDFETREHVLVWMLALASLIPVALLMAPAARTLIPVIPVEMILAVFLVSHTLNKLRLRYPGLGSLGHESGINPIR
jgi:hypothetical protein